MRAPLVAFVDQALPDDDFTRLVRAVRALGRERLRDSYQTTFWYELGAPPTSLVEVAVPTLLAKVPLGRRRDVVGVEWWLSRMRTSNVKVDFHRDRDNAYFEDTGRERHPRVSSLLYLSSCRGGLLAVTRASPEPRNPACAPTRHDFDFVEPRPNRFAFFDGRLTHGVLDANNQVPLRRLPTERRWRLAVAINLWAVRPRRVPAFADTPHYARLRTSPQPP
jgi:hypothetical protein